MGERRPMIAGNWKMYKTGEEAKDTAKQLVELVKEVKNTDIMIAPAFTSLASVFQAVKGSNVALGAQNLFWETQGAYTGEISPMMVKDAGCTHVILGHSERRQYFSETDESVNKKIKAAIENNLIPVFCVGETEAQRDSKETFSVLDKQIQIGLKGFSVKSLERLVVAYEPVWAIGTGKTATREQAQEVHAFIRNLLEKMFGLDLSDGIRILYGGSVKPENISELMALKDVDGALVGGASLTARTFADIVTFK
ncbi:MAG: triose-phosphate isomerase [Desulfobacteraceae bacterium]|nr:triose-phosphate isomerase [Desulfobacteraceae bacterium]MBU4053080.1 triose-phosphate isomerase [Pseudomonadota bacterium]